MNSPLSEYLKNTKTENQNDAMIAYIANLQQTAKVGSDIAASIVNELATQRAHLKLVASENYCSLSTQVTMGNLLTDKYAEGFPNHRYYGGCENIDTIESIAVEEAKALFNAEHAYVQPHSGADANLVAYWAILNKKIEIPELENLGETNVSNLKEEDWTLLRKKLGNQKLLGLDYYSGGHLTHGYRMNISARMFESHSYTVDKKTGLLDYDAIEKQAIEIKPLILLTGYSAYPRKINFRRFKEIADKCGAVLMVDMAHFAGLVAGKVFKDDYDPIKWADIVTTTTHKTLRGPRGALILCKKEYEDSVNKGCPLVLGGPLPHIMAAKAIALKEARKDNYKKWAKNVQENARSLAQECMNLGMKVQTNGTDNHLMLIDVSTFNLTGRQAENALFECGITVNRNTLPFDPMGPWWTSGIRIGTPAITSLGMGEDEMKEIAHILNFVLKGTKAHITKSGKKTKGKIDIDITIKETAQEKMKKLLSNFVLYPELDLAFLQKAFCNC